MARVVLVEDDGELRSSITDYLRLAGHDVCGVGSAVELYQQLAVETFDVAVLDINLPHYDGLSIASFLAEKTNLAIIMTTVRGQVEERVKGYQAGADLYLVKPVECEELSAAITAVIRRRAQAGGPSVAVGVGGGEVWGLDRVAFRLTSPDGKVVALTRREATLLERLTRMAGMIVERSDLQNLLGYDALDPSSRGLDAVISRLRAKIQTETGRPLPLQTVQGAGFLFSGAVRMV